MATAIGSKYTSNTIMGSTKALIAGLLALVAGAVAFGHLIRQWLRFRSARGWVTTRGRIIESCLYKDPKMYNTLHFRVNYEFETFSGEAIVGTTPRLCGDWFWTDSLQAKFVARFTQGDEVDVHYDPVSPHRNCIDREDGSSFAVESFLAIVFTTLGAVFVWLWCEANR